MFILAKKYGRLCNRLFNAAHLLAFAIEHEHRFVNLAFYEYREHFLGSQGDLFCCYPSRHGAAKGNNSLAVALYYLVYLYSSFLYVVSMLGLGIGLSRYRTVRPSHDVNGADTDLASLPIDFSDTAQVVFFQGWNLRANECLEKHGDKVRAYFQPTDRYRSDVGDFVQQRREGFDLLIGVVIRHGDYRTYLNGRYFYTTEIYLNFMNQLRELFKGQRINFLICSDEEQDTDLFRSAHLDFYFRSGHPIENLYALAGCDYIISPPSTYGMWASFYGKTPLCLIEDPDQTISSTDSFSICTG